MEEKQEEGTERKRIRWRRKWKERRWIEKSNNVFYNSQFIYCPGKHQFYKYWPVPNDFESGRERVNSLRVTGLQFYQYLKKERNLKILTFGAWECSTGRSSMNLHLELRNGRATAQAVSRWLPTATARVQIRV
jgi:hypothetical protein